MRKTWPVFILLILISSFHDTIYASSNTMQDLTMKIHVKADGSADITERWDMNMQDGTENYKVFKNMGDSSITQYHVSDENGAYEEASPWDINASHAQKTNKYGIVEKSDGYELCFGIGEYGSRIYTISYTIINFVDQYKDTQGIHWSLLDHDFAFKPNTFIATITSDIDLTKSVSEIHTYGYKGTYDVTNGAITLTNVNENDEAGEVDNINVFIGFKDNYFSNTNYQYSNKTYKEMEKWAQEGSDQKDHTLLRYIFYFIIGGIVLFLGLLYLISAAMSSNRLLFEDGIKLPDKKEINYFRDIPCKGDIYRYYYLIQKLNLVDKSDLENGILSAIILQWMKKGNITLKKVEKGGRTKKYEIELHPDVALPSALEKELFDYFKQAASPNTLIVTQSGFKSWCKDHYIELVSWFTKIDIKLGQQLLDSGECKIIEDDHRFYCITKRFYAPSIREEMMQIIGFQKFLKEFSRMAEKSTNEVHLWENYLIFALPLKLADKVEKEIGNLYPEFYDDSILQDVSIVSFAHVFMYNSFIQSRPSSFSGGIGGGFSSFGGGGGGSHGGGGGGSR